MSPRSGTTAGSATGWRSDETASPPGSSRSGASPGLAVLLAALVVGVLLAGCGGGSSSSDNSTAGASTKGAVSTSATSPADDSPDAGILNTVLARQEAAVDAYAAAIPHLAPGTAHLASYFRTQEQEHADGILKVMRGDGVAEEPKAETIDPGDRKTEDEWLLFLYEVENATIEEELTAIAGLAEDAPRSLMATTIANQAQHLTLLRRALGTGALGSIPDPFENGTVEPPR